jgi:L-methionine (R)-S-oxide reductase
MRRPAVIAAHDIATLLRDAATSSEGLGLALDAILAATGTTSGTVHVLPPGESVMRLVASRGVPPVVLERVQLVPVGKGMAGVAVEQRRPITTCNLQQDDAGGVIRPGAKATGAQGAVAVPLLHDGRAVGALGVATQQAREFTAAEVDELLAVGRVLAEALTARGADGPGAPPTVSVHVPTPLRERCGGAAELSVPASSVRAALAELERRHPELHRSVCDETGAVRRHINLFVNTAHVRDRGGLDAPLAAGDVLMILPAVSGG